MRLPRLATILGAALLVASLIVPGGAQPAFAIASDDNVVLRWNDATLQAIRDSRHGPPMIARALAMIHTAMFDAWAAYDPVAVGAHLGDSLRRPASEHTDENREQAMSHAAHRVLCDLFPTLKADFNATMNGLGYRPNDASTDVATPAGVGIAAADAVLRFRRSDGSNQLGDLAQGAYADYTGYRPVNDLDLVSDPNRWQPLRFSDGAGGTVAPRFMAPHWSNVTPFALGSPDQFRPPPPARYPDPQFTEQARQLVQFSADLTDREKVIVEYWGDGPASELPPGHWNLLAQVVSRRDGHTVGQDVRLFFALNNALFDAGIAAWDAKLHYDYVRPVTAIRWLYRGEQIRAWGGPGRGTQTIKGEDWLPYQPPTFITPPFPEYVSGHSTFSAAAAEVLYRFTGSDRFDASVTLPVGWSRVEPRLVPAAPITLSWATFSDAAEEAGLSRRYGGIHFEDADVQGRWMGRQVGALALRKASSYWEGTAPR